MATNPCPFCGSDKCTYDALTGNITGYKVQCIGLGANFYIKSEINNNNDKTFQLRLINLIVERLIRQKTPPVTNRKFLWYFDYNENTKTTEDIEVPHYVNLAEEIKLYPANIVERVERALLNIAFMYPDVGCLIDFSEKSTLQQHMLYCISNEPEDELNTIIKYLQTNDYIESDLRFPMIELTYLGWEKVEELTKRFSEINQGFIAMSYNQALKPIMDSFRSAILASGYKPQVIGEKEHNNQIVPEMFYEIGRSKFMVVDVSEPNLGAYYEAGYAQALGKEVIVCCSKEAFDDQIRKPHFDIAQKPIIVWTSLGDLEEKLKRRIEATVR